MTVSSTVFTVCLAVGVGLFIYQIWGRFSLLLVAQPAALFDRIPERIWAVIVYAFGQKKFIRPQAAIVKEQPAGWIHFFVFWGFTLLGIQVVTMFGRAWFPDFAPFPFWPGLLGGPYALVRDCFEVAVFACILILLARWLVTRPQRLMGFPPAEDRHLHHAHGEAVFILVCIGLIVSGGLVYDGGRLVQAELDGTLNEMIAPTWEPFSFLMGKILLGIGGAGFAIAASDAAWWVHNLSVLTMLNFLPLAKHFHIITSLPNVFFRKLEPLGALSKQELDENTVRFGASHIDHFTWKQMLDMFSCTECGRCSSQCPATATGKPLAPRQLLLDLRDYLYEKQPEIIAARQAAITKAPGWEPAPIGDVVVKPLADPTHVVADETIWSCNMCRACEESCPVMIEYVDKIADMRRYLVQEEARFPEELNRVFKNMEVNSNPWGIGADKRFDWADGLDVPLFADKPDAEYLYFVGCAGAYDDRNKKVTQAFARVLLRAGVDVACLGPEEMCNGDSARRLGNEYLFQAMAQTNVEQLNGYGVKKVIVNCPHCFNTIKNEYPQFGGRYEVVHAADLVRQLAAQGRLPMNGEGLRGTATTYHDSCYYGRFNDVYDAPREVLAQTGAHVQEVPHRHHQFGMCCGAGGGRMWIEEDPDKRVNLKRTDQILGSDPKVVASSCPFCMIMLSDGVKAKDVEEQVQVLDVMEIVDRATR
jgi:Fe-S oxidoreductase